MGMSLNLNKSKNKKKNLEEGCNFCIQLF